MKGWMETMGKIYKSAAELIGNTPLLELSNIEKKENLEATILAKVEYYNPKRKGQNCQGNDRGRREQRSS